MLWSATWPKSVARLARDFQKDIVHIQVGSEDLSTNTDIEQVISDGISWGPLMPGDIPIIPGDGSIMPTTVLYENDTKGH